MNHPDLNELIEFVSMDKLTPETLDASAHINAHLADCADCRARVRDLQKVYDALLCKVGTAAQAARLLAEVERRKTIPGALES